MSVIDYAQRDEALLARNVLAREQLVGDAVLHPDNCGPCRECVEFSHDLALSATRSSATPETKLVRRLGRVTLDALFKHAKRYGAEGIMELATTALTEIESAQLRVRLVREGVLKRESRRGVPSSKEQVVDLQRRGLAVDEIADAMCISERRVRAALGEAKRDEE